MGIHTAQQEDCSCFLLQGLSCRPVAIQLTPCRGAVGLVRLHDLADIQQNHTLCTSSTGCGFSPISGLPGDKSLVRLSPSSLTVMEVICTEFVKRSCTFPVTKSRLVKWPCGLSSTSFTYMLLTQLPNHLKGVSSSRIHVAWFKNHRVWRC